MGARGLLIENAVESPAAAGPGKGMRIAVHDYAGHPFQFQLTRALARRGHDARHFYYGDDVGPKGADASGDDPPTYSSQPLSIGGAYSKANFLQRLAGDVRYGAVAAAAITEFQPDVVISGNTPLDAQAQILRAARRSGAGFVFWMQDFFSLAVARLLGRRWLGAGALVAARYRRLEKRLLRASDAVVLISEDFQPPLRGFGLEPGKVFVIPNWGALDEIPVTDKASAWAAAQGLADKVVFLYSGTLALKHDPDLLWALAEAFREDADVVVALAAAGVSAEALQRRQLAEPLPNLVFLPLQPMDRFPALLGAADILVALLENDAGEFSVPSKILSYLCAGRPILLSAPPANAAARMVERARAGKVVAADDEAAFLAEARRLRADADLRRSLGEAGRRYAETAFDVEAVADRFEAVIAAARRR
jgi:colanic acid biosynthesis glycosyl transferase WcaI